ncbi:MAG: hypothetical protein LBT36_06590, partial [Oscillospiraceae bacterium]|nr:hypothetical protein [Oscillospiraceae bacterium]
FPGALSVWLYALFFGHYPVVTMFLERVRVKAARRIAKLAVFYASLALSAFVALRVLALDAAATAYAWVLTPWGAPLAAIALGIVFAVYDIGYGKLLLFFRERILPHMGGRR